MEGLDIILFSALHVHYYERHVSPSDPETSTNMMIIFVDVPGWGKMEQVES